MSANYNELLEATIQHLENLKARGVRHVAVEAETLRALSLPPKTVPAPVARPAAPTARSVAPAPTPVVIKTKKPEELPILPAEVSPAIPAFNATEKAAAFAALRERAMACVKCANLAAARQNVVFGVGNIDAELMFVGEAPGADEDEQ